ncbi:MAG: glycosyltransferase [Bacteroidetes bacterium]|nr:glycosyltransferase [Bacteroidota bacterium]
MRILVLCNKSPWPLHEGGPIAMHAIIDGLIKAGHNVKVLAANTNKYFVDPNSIPYSFAESTSIEFANIDLSVNPIGALVNYIKGNSYHVARFRNRDFGAKLIKILQEEEYDIIQAEMIYTTVYLDIIRKYSKAKVILRAHNIEHLIWKRIAENQKNLLKKHYLNHLYRTLRNYELGIIGKVDGIVAITETDAVILRKHSGKVPVISIPYGIDIESLPAVNSSQGAPDLFHIGSMNWIPNEEGIRWFIENVWTKVSTLIPGIQLYLAGRMMPEWLIQLNMEGVNVVGEVPDAMEFVLDHQVMIVPLFSGSGIRIKIIEAMSAGKAVISTSIGAEGILYKNRTHLWIADTAEQFVEAILEVMSNPGCRKELGINARKLMETLHNNSLLMVELVNFYKQLDIQK